MYIIIFLFLHYRYLKLVHTGNNYIVLHYSNTFVIYFLFVSAFPLEILALVDAIFENRSEIKFLID